MAYFLFNHPGDNVAPAATWSIPSSADPDFIAAYAPDLTDENLGRPAKVTTTTGDFVATFVGAQRIDLPVIWHNLDNGVQFHLQASTSPTFSPLGMDVTLTASAKRDDGYTYKSWVDLTKQSGYLIGGYRYWRLHFPNANSVPIGVKVWFGNIIRVLDRPLETGLKQPEHHVSIGLVTDFAYRWSYDLEVAPRILTGKVNASLRPGNTGSLPDLQAWMRSAGGAFGISAMVPDPNWPFPDAWIVRFMNQPGSNLETLNGLVQFMADFQYINPASHPIQLGWEEVSAGAPEWL